VHVHVYKNQASLVSGFYSPTIVYPKLKLFSDNNYMSIFLYNNYISIFLYNNYGSTKCKVTI